MSETKSEKEKKSLTEAELKRLERFNAVTKEMEEQGYTCHDLTINIVTANLFAVLLLIPLFAVGYGLNYFVNRALHFGSLSVVSFIIAYIVLIVVHELIHGLSWSLYTPHGFKDMEFGVLKSSMTPYCACLVPLKKPQYIFGTIMPFIILGVIPMILGILINNATVLFLGIVMADAAAGDLMIIEKLLRYKSDAAEIIYMDHPTKAGGVVFER